MGKDNKTHSNESNEPKRELVKFSMGTSNDKMLSLEDDSNDKFDQFEHNKKKFGISSTYDETFYTTKLNMDNFTEEQKQRAAKLEREIESKGKIGGGSNKRHFYNNDHDEEMPDYNEDEDENMDTNADQNYDDFIADKVVFSIEDIEAKQLSMSNQASSTQQVELDQDENENSENLNEVYYNEMLDNDDEINRIQDGNSDNEDDANEETEISTNDENNLEKEQKQGLDLKSSAFTPKVRNSITSTKSIDEFEISGNANTAVKEPVGKKMNTSSTSFKPSLKSGSQPFKPGGSQALVSNKSQPFVPKTSQPFIPKPTQSLTPSGSQSFNPSEAAKPAPSLSQSQAPPYNYTPMGDYTQHQVQNQQQKYMNVQPAPGLSQNWGGSSYAPNYAGQSDQQHYGQFQNTNGGAYQQLDHSKMQQMQGKDQK